MSDAQLAELLAVVALANDTNDTNRLANGYHVPVDPQFIPEHS